MKWQLLCHGIHHSSLMLLYILYRLYAERNECFIIESMDLIIYLQRVCFNRQFTSNLTISWLEVLIAVPLFQFQLGCLKLAHTQLIQWSNRYQGVVSTQTLGLLFSDSPHFSMALIVLYSFLCFFSPGTLWGFLSELQPPVWTPPNMVWCISYRKIRYLFWADPFFQVSTPSQVCLLHFNHQCLQGFVFVFCLEFIAVI